MNIDHQKAVKEYKVQTLKSLETWIKSCADDVESDIISDIEAAEFEHTGSGAIPGTLRLYFRLQRNSREKYSCHVIKDAHAIWEYLSHTPFDEFSKMVPRFHNYCMFLYHSKTYTITCMIGVYQVLVVLVQLGLTPDKAVKLVSTLALNVVFLVLYILAYGVFRGNLIQTEGLSSYVHGGLSDAQSMERLHRGMSGSSKKKKRVETGVSSDPPMVRRATHPVNDGFKTSRELTYGTLCGIMIRRCCKLLGDVCCWWYGGALRELQNRGIALDKTAQKLLELQKSEAHSASLSTSSAFYRVDAQENRRDYDVFRKYKRPLLGFYQQLNICYKFISLLGESGKKASPPGYIQRYLMYIGFYVAFISVVSFVANIGSVAECHGVDSLYCSSQRFQFYSSGFGTFPLLLDLVIISNLFVAFAALMYGADVAVKLADLWIFRYSSIRRVCVRDLTGGEEVDLTEEAVASYFADVIAEGCDEQSSDSSSDPHAPGKKPQGLQLAVPDMIKLLQHFPSDAQECYAFRQEFMQQLTQTWNFFLFVVLALSLTLLLTEIFGNRWTLHWFVQEIFTLIFNSVYYALPLMCLASANDAANSLRGLISSSGLTDFDVIGGRDVWGEYISGAPAYWTIMGLPVTCKYSTCLYISLHPHLLILTSCALCVN